MRAIGVGVLLVSAVVVSISPSAAAASPLVAEDQEILEKLIGHPLVDPVGARWVRIKAPVRTVWTEVAQVEREGWLTPAANGQPPRVYFPGGESMPAPPETEMVHVEFVAECQKRYGAPTQEQEEREETRGDVFRNMRLVALGGPELDDNDLVAAAWLHRLGQDGLAAQALARARTAAKRQEIDPIQMLQRDLAWGAFAGMVHAYMVRADDEALEFAERFNALKPEGNEYEQAPLIYQELKRRQKAGTFGKTPSTQPADDAARWPADRKLAYWIAALDEVDARQWGQPGGIDLSSDPRVAALIGLGEAAVPALIDTVEKDERLTRSVHFWRDFSHDRKVLSVREAALTAVMSILKVQVFEPVSTGDSFTGRGDEGTKQVVAKLRAYWAKYGNMPFDQRMMNILTDEAASVEAWREAASNLARLGEDRTLGTTVWTSRSSGATTRPNPAVAKFTNPTTAEAMLAALDRDLARLDASGKGDQLYEYHRDQIEDIYLGALVQLGDRRTAAETGRRSAAAKTLSLRRKFAFASHALGDPKPFEAFANDVAAGKVSLPGDTRPDLNPNDQPATVELKAIVGMLTAAKTPQADAALFALAGASHPLHQLALTNVLHGRRGWHDDAVWYAHPYWIPLLRPALDDTRQTGGRFMIDDGALKHLTQQGSSSTGIPYLLRDATQRLSAADERACDVAAQLYSETLLGVPECHPLLKDNDHRLTRLRAFLDRFGRNFRLLTPKETEALQRSVWEIPLIPDIRPLGRPATEQDVQAGRSLFNLPPGAKVADTRLPAVSYRKSDPEHKEMPVLIVQAEVGLDGRVVYGVIGRSEVGAMPAEDLEAVQSIDNLADSPGA